MNLCEGTIVEGALGKYELMHRLARGGYGEVWLARTGANKPCAVKFSHPGGTGDIQNEAMFNELGRKGGPAAEIDRFFDQGVDTERRPFFVRRRYLCTLADWLASQPPPRVECRAHALKQVVSKVSRMSGPGGGIIHRDLKSPNFLLLPTVGGFVTVVLVDAGLAREVLPGTTPLLTGRGTPEYQSWDARLLRRASAAVDAFATGVIVYEGLVGSRPEAVAGHGHAWTPYGQRLLRLTELRRHGSLQLEEESEQARLAGLADAALVTMERLSSLTEGDVARLETALKRDLDVHAAKRAVKTLLPALRQALDPKPDQRSVEPLLAPLGALIPPGMLDTLGLDRR